MKRIVLVLTVLLAGCGGSSSSPTEPSCPNIAGSWAGSFTDSCGRHGTGNVGITQQGCSFQMVGLAGPVSGNLSGNNGSFSFPMSSPCTGNGSGTLAVSGNMISGSFTAQVGGPSAQCCVGSTSGGFTLAR